MSKETIKLKSFNDGYGDYFFAKKRCDPLLCRSTLSDLFTLPRHKRKSISFVISDKKLPNSYKAKFDWDTVKLFYGGQWQTEITYIDAKEILRSLGLTNKEFWVSLYWEE